MKPETRLTALAERLAARPETSNVVWRIERPSHGWTWSFGDQTQPYFIASVTKLYVTALILQLVDEGLVSLDAAATDYLPAGTMAGLNAFGGTDHGREITVRHLISQTSGIPDYFDGTGGMLSKLLAGDLSWDDQIALEIARRMKAPFAPGEGRALYSDTNFQLLGMIIERATDATFEECLRARILARLGLASTYPFTTETLDRYPGIASVHSGRRQLTIPRAMASCRAQGGIVSTAPDQIRFLRAFFDGELFDRLHLPTLGIRFNRVFGPLSYGLGVMRYRIPRALTLFAPIPELTGHSGSTGTVLFHSPEHDLFIAGAVNQLAKRSLVYQSLARMAQIAARA